MPTGISGKNAPSKKTVVAPPKLQNELQEICALFCLLEVYKKGEMKESELKNKLFEAYHGQGSGNKVSAIDLLLAGDDRFAILWEGEKRELAQLLPGNLTDKKSTRYNVNNFTVGSLRKTTAKGKSLADGRSILAKAKKALKNCKKYLALWTSKLINNQHIPSGLNEDDILAAVIKTLYIEHMKDKRDGAADDDDNDGGSDCDSEEDIEVPTQILDR